MKENNKFFRMSFIVQDNAAMTLETNLIKIIEAMLFESKEQQLSSDQIAQKIKSDLELDFSEEEIKNAITNKGKNIQRCGERYTLLPSYRDKLSKQENFKSHIEKFARMAIKELGMEVSEAKLINLLTEYLYYCFNSNKDSILSLIDKREVKDTGFLKKEEDVKLINSFLGWKNDDKDRFVYNVVSYGYIYCTLTVKKDDLLANKIFRGKSFVLDANIIFRLAGINNDSRKSTIKSFVEKCKEVGVTLCYTTVTLDEIKRVITNKVNWIKAVTGSQMPLDLKEYDYSENDFYTIYCDWSSKGGSQYNDFIAFQKYLSNLIFDVLEELKCIESTNYEIKKSTEFGELTTSLSQYKEEHTIKRQSQASIKTDVNNIMYIKEMRKNEKNANLWNTNVYFISADQNLIKWIEDIESGIPLVVLPSVWLTILLRFSGRTANDYKAFCTFLELRTHQPEASINVYQLLENLSEKTDSNELKKMVVKEVFEHKDEYEGMVDDDYDKLVDKAFDNILLDKENEEKEKINQLKSEFEKKEKELVDLETQKITDDEFKIRSLIENDSERHFGVIDFINKIKLPVAFGIFVALVIFTVFAFEQKGVLYWLFVLISPEIANGTGNILSTIGIFWAIVVPLAGFIGGFFHYLSSDRKKERYKKKREIYYRKLFEQTNNRK